MGLDLYATVKGSGFVGGYADGAHATTTGQGQGY